MSADTATAEAPQLLHIHTLSSPTGITRAWSSRPHPSPRYPLLATASSDRSVQVWDLKDYKLVSTINGGHKRSIRCVGWKDWGRTGGNKSTGSTQVPSAAAAATANQKPVTLATGSFDANVGIWVHDPLSTNDQDRREQRSAGEEELDMTTAPDGGGDEGEEEEEWHFTTLLTGPDSEIKDLQFSPAHYGANLLATCSRDKSVWIWEEVEDDNEWETIAVLNEHTGDVKCVGWCAGATTTIDGEEHVIGSREILATGSYDDTIRLWRDVEEEGDWDCVAVVEGHKGTVWDLCWESCLDSTFVTDGSDVREWEPRLISCSDDMTVKLWRRELSDTEKEKKKERLANGTGPKKDKLPSIIRPSGTREKWVEEVTLPQIHLRSIYAVDWSQRTGLVVSGGGDGTIVVYREVLDAEDVVMNGTEEEDDDLSRKKTKWVVAAVIEAAHDEYEVNHVCWATRRDKEKRYDSEEVIVSTGDDGDVRIWALPEEIIDETWKSQ